MASGMGRVRSRNRRRVTWGQDHAEGARPETLTVPVRRLQKDLRPEHWFKPGDLKSKGQGSREMQTSLCRSDWERTPAMTVDVVQPLVMSPARSKRNELQDRLLASLNSHSWGET